MLDLQEVDKQGRTMQTKTQRLILRGGIIVLAALLVSTVGAVGLTQVLPSTARLYEPGLTTQQLYDRDTNLRIGFRYLRDLLDRYPANMSLALLAYNRGPAKVEQLLGAGRDPANGYEAEV